MLRFVVFDGCVLLLLNRFCPSVFLYLSSIVPAIWLLELDKVERRMKNFGSNVIFNDTFDLTNVEDLKKLQKTLGVS